MQEQLGKGWRLAVVARLQEVVEVRVVIELQQASPSQGPKPLSSALVGTVG